ncbi:2-oxo acid dehydrogenase subunit E2 [Halomarina halobia]|uniref:2-oxo acid dehydrogenase subunit E2 n=1 Tax=Halomarina halobia TaxID=3033386 RepID=A0ABD6AGY0_9EURY|nr:2-oxo acid dehydrogenase subunit E2 [Halomarina sp. PSR21]
MVEIITLPKLGISDEGELIAWEFDTGEHVEDGDVIAVLESDKATAEVTATASGILLETYLDEGDVVPIEPGRPIAVVGEEGDTVPDYEDLLERGSDVDRKAVELSEEETVTSAGDRGESDGPNRDEADVKATPRAKRHAREQGVPLESVDGTGPQGVVTEADVNNYLDATDGAATIEPTDSDEETRTASVDRSADVKATPRAKKIAKECDVDLSSVEGTGPQGAVTEDDIREQGERASERSERGLTITERRSLTGTRRTIADRLARSAREKPHVMGTRDISIEQLLRVKRRLDEERSEDISLNDLILAAVVRTLGDFPEFNALFEDDAHKLVEEINVGYAVDAPKGLVVPVVRNAAEKSIFALAEERRAVVRRVLNDDHTSEDLTDGTFTVTNIGVFDLDVSYSIINPPQVAILAIGRRKPAAFERNGEVRFEKAITFSLTIDHRVLDGADTGAFLARLADYIEYPGFAIEELNGANRNTDGS